MQSIPAGCGNDSPTSQTHVTTNQLFDSICQTWHLKHLLGQPCAFDGIQGHFLGADNQVLVLDTCGTSSLVAGFPRQDASVVKVDSSLKALWGSVAISGQGGEYRLCWCEGLHFPCSVSENLRVDIGQLTVIGPTPIEQGLGVPGSVLKFPTGFDVLI